MTDSKLLKTITIPGPVFINVTFDCAVITAQLELRENASWGKHIKDSVKTTSVP